MEDLRRALVSGKADAVLAASIFHYGICSILEAKEYLAKRELRYESKIKSRSLLASQVGGKPVTVYDDVQ